MDRDSIFVNIEKRKGKDGLLTVLRLPPPTVKTNLMNPNFQLYEFISKVGACDFILILVI